MPESRPWIAPDVIAQHFGRIVPGVGGDADELHPVGHASIGRHLLDIGDHFGMQRANVGAGGIDEVQHHDLAREVVQLDGIAGGIMEHKFRRGFGDGLEIRFAVVEFGGDFARAMRQPNTGQGQQKGCGKQQN